MRENRGYARPKVAGARFAIGSLRREQPRGNTMNVLIIDDEPSLRRTLRTALEAMGHHATEARDGPQALDLAGHRQFDLAFLDLRLGGAQGLDLLPELLRLAPGLAVVVITAYATIATAVE